MKKQTLYGIAVSVLFLLFGSLSASAQSQEHMMKVEVPFDFQVSGKVLSAGKYLIKRDSLMPQLLRIQSVARGDSVVVLCSRQSLAKQHNQASLLFKGYAEKHFLSEVRFPGFGFGYSLTESKAEHKLAQAVRVDGQR